MSALLSIGEANHAILNAGAEISFASFHIAKDAAEPRRALAAAQVQLVHARSVLAAVRLALRTQAMFDALEYHQEMAVRLRLGAIRAHMQPGRGLHASADRHSAFAAALRTLIGSADTSFTGGALVDEPLPRRPLGEKGPHAS